jgi:peptidylprolyl isomerase
MPSSKEVRARQSRQKERIAAQHAERQRVHERRKRIGIAVGTALVVVLIVLGVAKVLGNNDNKKASVAAATPTTTPSPKSTPTTSPSATATITAPPKLASVKGKPCVGLKDPLPKGSPKFTVPSGPAPTKLTTSDLKPGTGAVIPQNAKVSVNYVGVACSTGKIFDSSYKRSQPLEADLGSGIIDGWKQGLPGMRIGGVRVIGIPSSLAYKATGVADAGIAPDEALYFLVAPVKLG